MDVSNHNLIELTGARVQENVSEAQTVLSPMFVSKIYTSGFQPVVGNSAILWEEFLCTKKYSKLF